MPVPALQGLRTAAGRAAPALPNLGGLELPAGAEAEIARLFGQNVIHDLEDAARGRAVYELPGPGGQYSTPETRDVADSDYRTRALAGLKDSLDAQYSGPQMQRQARNKASVQPLEEGMADVASERAAGRQFLPEAERLHGRTMQDTGAKLYEQYGRPAEIDQQTKLGQSELTLEGVEGRNAATTAAAGQTHDAATYGHDVALFNGLDALKDLSPEDKAMLAALRATLAKRLQR